MSYIKAIPSVLSKTANYTVSTNDGDNVQVNVDATSGAATITFYAASGNTGKIITVKKTDSSANAVTLDGNASETLDGATTATLATQYDSATFVCDGTNWQKASAYSDSPSVSSLTISGTTTLQQAFEKITISATAATGTIQYDSLTQAVLYYTSNASANWTLNVRGSSGTSLDTALATGKSVTVVFLVTQGSTAYYPTSLTIDGNSVTPKWQGGSAPSAGNTSSVDAYVYNIVKTGSAAFTVFASQTRFA